MDFWVYLGVDWLAMLLTFIAIWLIGNKSRSGFVVMIFGNLCWIVVGVMSGSSAMWVANMIFALMNVRAIIKWTDVDAV